MQFPDYRPRRMRRTENRRRMVRETRLDVSCFVYPLFVVPGENVTEEIPSMPGQYRYSVDTLMEEVSSIVDLGIRAVILFGLPNKKDPLGSEAFAKDGYLWVGVNDRKRCFTLKGGNVGIMGGIPAGNNSLCQCSGCH